MPAQACEKSGLDAITGTMGLSWESAAWVRVDLIVLMQCWCKGDLPLLGRGESPPSVLATVAPSMVWGARGAGRGRKPPSQGVTKRRGLDCELSHQHSSAFCCMLVINLWAHMRVHEQPRCSKHKSELTHFHHYSSKQQ